MTITDKQNQDLQAQYDKLRAQGLSWADATASIKTTLQNSPTTWGGNAFSSLQSSYKTGGVVGDWIPPSTIKTPAVPTTGVPNINVPVVTPGTSVPTSTATGGVPTTPSPWAVGASQVMSGTTGVAPVDTAIQANIKAGEKASKEYQDAFAIQSADYQNRKGDFLNFDAVNDKATEVRDAVTAEMVKSGWALTEQQYQNIANSLGITVGQAKDYRSLYTDPSSLSEQGKQRYGVTNYEQNLSDSAIALERKKQDIATNLQNAEINTNQQIDDVQKQLERNVNWANAQGAWTGAMNSSAYTQGIQNMKDDGAKTIGRLKDAYARMKNATDEDLSRLTTDYNTALTRAKTDFDFQSKNLLSDVGVQMNLARDKYGLGSTEMTTALDDISAKYGEKSFDIWNKFVSGWKTIQDQTNANVEAQMKVQDKIDAKMDKKYTEYIANNGAMLANTSVKTLLEDVNSGALPPTRVGDLVTSMMNGIQSTLSKTSPVSTEDIKNIQAMINAGKTPAEIIATFQTQERFKPKASIEKTIDLGDRIRVTYSDGKSEDIQKGTEAMTAYQKASLAQNARSDSEANKLAREKMNLEYGVTPTTPTSPVAEPTGSTENVMVGKKNIIIDSSAADALRNVSWTIPNLKISGGMRSQETQYKLFGKGRTEQQMVAAWVPADKAKQYAAPSESQVTWTTSSEHMKGMAVDVVPEGEKKADQVAYLSSIEKQMNENGFFRPASTMAKGDYGHFEYTGQPIGGDIANIDGNAITRIMWRLPTQLKNTQAEYDRNSKVAKSLLASGLKEQEVIDTLFWVDKNKIPEANRDAVMPVIRRLPQDSQLTIISTFAENPKQWVMALEDAINANARKADPDGFISDRITSTIARRSDELDALIKQLSTTEEGKKNPIGNFDGTMEDYLGRFKSKEAVAIGNKAARLVQDFRKLNLGSAVTPSEEKFLEDVTPKIFDSVDNFDTKISEFKQQSISQYNDFRRTNGLPEIGEDAILDTKKRINYYSTTPSTASSTSGNMSIQDRIKALRNPKK